MTADAMFANHSCVFPTWMVLIGILTKKNDIGQVRGQGPGSISASAIIRLLVSSNNESAVMVILKPF